jgi:hypothetical protein
LKGDGMLIGTELFKAVNNWLGWGDPDNGLWFIGMEEGATFNGSEIKRKGKQFDPIEDDKDLNWNVANTTAKVISKLLNHQNFYEYRDNLMWKNGSKVFNGNLLPLGKPKRSDWPSAYEELFGFGHNDYSAYIQEVKKDRYNLFREFRERMNPQAVVCFGKDFWPEYVSLFVQNPNDIKLYSEYNVVVYEKDRVILTGHFSYGRWMPNISVQFVADQLSKWGVKL